jgi:glyoxylase-like metal-dependent hydrolase (beta-lactamase superfamily II)
VPAEFDPGRLVSLAPGILRLTAPNAGRMTGPGTNSYLLGSPPRAVLDPGPDLPAHLEALWRAAPSLELILVTHTHPDHSPAAAALASAGRARGREMRLVGRPPPTASHQDTSFTPTQVPARDELIHIDAGLTLRAIDTPGHASNHVCYLAEPQGMLFSGDHVLDGVTPVILAPDGDMTAYLEALERLLRYPLRSIAPGHGRLLEDPGAVIRGVIAHRQRRERKVEDALRARSPVTVDALLPHVYDDVSPELHAMARHSLEAHLVKLEREGRAGLDGDLWRAE